MCCFTRPVISVNTTRIFARAGHGPGQFLVYSMTVEAKEEMAMVLPLPIKPGTDEKGVTFINLQDYSAFFDDLEKGFPAETVANDSVVTNSWAAAPRLAVMQVGNFEASFVPTVKDFARLDARFRLPEGVWDKLPGYRSHGFAVFKLKSGLLKVHPMAFSFPRADARSLFFPTVHIHDGKVHAKADFDHLLYCQPAELGQLALGQWRESPKHAGSFMKLDIAKGLIEPDQHCHRLELNGELPNRDTMVSVNV